MKYLSLCFAIFCCFSFSNGLAQQVNSSVKRINLTAGLASDETKMYLSEIAEKVEYVFLETSNECLLDKIKKVIVDDSLVFISDKKQLLIFNSSGKFITAVGGVGRGPGEYVEVMDFSVDLSKDRIFVLDRYQQKVLCYAYNGKYQSSFRFRTPYPSKIEVIKNSGLIISYSTPQFLRNNNYGFALYTFDGKFIQNSFNRQNEGAKQAMGEAGLHRLNYYCDSLTFREVHLDTIYRVSNDGRFTPRYAIDYKGYKEVKNRDSLEKNNFRFSYFIESKKYLFFLRGSRNGDIKHLVYHKEKDEAVNIRFNTQDSRLKYTTGFFNDIDGGYPFLPVDALDDGRLYCTFYPYEFKKLLKNDPYKGLDILNIEQKKDFYNRVEKSADMDNPVLMFVKLK